MADTNLDADLLANFIHQAINPLNAICGTIDNIVDGTVPADKRMQKMRAARAQLEQCVSLIRNLAYFAGTATSLTETRSKASVEPCVIPELIIEAIQFFQEVGSVKDVAIELDDPVTQYMVRGVRPLLRQVFMNLIDNAVKYSQPHSKVVIHPWIQKSTQNLLVSISSAGTPVNKGEEEKIFEVGFRGQNARAKTLSGSGLGLPICRMIMRSHFEGDIALEPTPQQGETIFLLRFPKFELLPNRISPETGRREQARKSKPKGRAHNRR